MTTAGNSRAGPLYSARPTLIRRKCAERRERKREREKLNYRAVIGCAYTSVRPFGSDKVAQWCGSPLQAINQNMIITHESAEEIWLRSVALVGNHPQLISRVIYRSQTFRQSSVSQPAPLSLATIDIWCRTWWRKCSFEYQSRRWRRFVRPRKLWFSTQ